LPGAARLRKLPGVWGEAANGKPPVRWAGLGRTA
jgi:hypothetical protein